MRDHPVGMGQLEPQNHQLNELAHGHSPNSGRKKERLKRSSRGAVAILGQLSVLVSQALCSPFALAIAA